VGVIDIEPIRERFSALAPFLDARGRRLVAAAQAFAAGYGGIAAVAMATGLPPSTIGRGLKELAWEEPSERVRGAGSGTQTAVSKDPTLAGLRSAGRTNDARRPGFTIAVDLQECAPTGASAPAQGHEVSRTLVAGLLNDAGYSLQGNRKTKEAIATPTGMGSLATSTPSGRGSGGKAAGDLGRQPRRRNWSGTSATRPRVSSQANPEEVRVHDFLIKELGRAVPYGVYDLAANFGWSVSGLTMTRLPLR